MSVGKNIPVATIRCTVRKWRSSNDDQQPKCTMMISIAEKRTLVNGIVMCGSSDQRGPCASGRKCLTAQATRAFPKAEKDQIGTQLNVASSFGRSAPKRGGR